MLSDRELATRVAVSGDQAAFAQLVDRHQGPVRQFLRRLTAGDDAAADDLAQETFLAAYTKMHTFKGTAKLTTWLHTIAYRQFIGLTRKQKRITLPGELPDPGHDPRTAQESKILVQQLMGELNEVDRACLTLSYAVGMSHAEIGAIVDLPVGSVKSRIHRARKKLQDWLKEHDHSLQTQTAAEGGKA